MSAFHTRKLQAYYYSFLELADFLSYEEVWQPLASNLSDEVDKLATRHSELFKYCLDQFDCLKLGLRLQLADSSYITLFAIVDVIVGDIPALAEMLGCQSRS